MDYLDNNISLERLKHMGIKARANNPDLLKMVGNRRNHFKYDNDIVLNRKHKCDDTDTPINTNYRSPN